MKAQSISKILAMVLVAAMLISALPISAFAASIDYTEAQDGYYKVLSKQDYEIAPGITESAMVLNNMDGDRRQVVHVMQADVTNPYVKVIPSSKGMIPTEGQYGVQVMSEQAAYAEANGYGNVVGAMNISLSWYDSDYYDQHPELVGEPLGYLVLDGKLYKNSRGQTSGAQTCLVINYDEKNGEARPADIPKTQLRSTADPITGWEEQVIPANFGFLVKDGKPVNKTESHTGGASRSMLGIKEDGTIVMVLNDGRLSPYSEGFNDYEMSQFMVSIGCVYAVNGDGGGSSTYLSQRPGEELELHSTPSDGAERATTHGILMISTAPATGEFARANISSEYNYYTPGSTVEFTALGTDLVGTATEIPEDAVWQLKDPSMGTVENGVFVSNGTVGEAVVQLVYNGETVGEDTISIVDPDMLSIGVNNLVAPYGKDVTLAVSALYNYQEVCYQDGDITISLSDAAMGSLNGNVFTATDDMAVTSGTITLTYSESLKLEIPVTFGKGSEVLLDFEGYDKTELHSNVNYANVSSEVGYVTKENGQVKSGDSALALKVDYTQVNTQGGWIYAGLNVNQEEDLVIPADAISWGMWIYVPEEAVGLELDFRPFHKKGTSYSRLDLIPFENGFATTFDESGWHYVSVDVSSYGELILPGINSTRVSEKQKRAAFEFYNPPTANSGYNYPGYTNNAYRSINGTFTIYLDDMTVDYSTAVEDREEPTFASITATYGSLDEGVALTGQTVNDNQIIFATKPAENTTKTNYTGINYNTAKAFVDGVDVTETMTVGIDGSLILSQTALKDGVHTIKFSIEDNNGNYASIIRQVNVQTGSDDVTIKVQPKDATLDRIAIGSLYYMDVVATAIEEVNQVEVRIDLNNSSEWEPQGMEVAEGFTATCSVDPVDEIATILIEKVDDVTATGEAALVSIPARTWESTREQYDAALTPEAIWKSRNIWAQDMQFTVKYGKLVCVDGEESTFSAAKHTVVTELEYSAASAPADFWAKATSWHIHTVEAIADADATCTKNGYTDRTFCEGCNSVIDWGTVIPATGHTYEFVDGVLKCECAKLFNGTKDGVLYVDGVLANGWIGESYYRDGAKLVGAHAIDNVFYNFSADGISEGKVTGLFFDEDAQVYRYAISGEAKSGWFMIGDNWHYFRTGTLAAATGTRYYFSGIPYEYDETGRLLHVVWVEFGNSYRCYYGPTFYTGTDMGTWTMVEGKQYCFVAGGEVLTGYQTLRASFNTPYRLYQFDSKGVYIGESTDYSGFVNGFDGIRYYVDGEMQTGLHIIDGNYYYFSTTTGAARTGKYTVSIANSNGLLTKETTFNFDPETGAAAEKPLNGFVKENGNTYYYIDNVMQKGLQLIDGSYYYFSTNTGIMRTGEYTATVANSNGLLTKNTTFHFDPETGAAAEKPLNGFVKENGNTYYYINNVMQKGLQLIDGSYYYFSTNTGIMRTGEYTATVANSNGLLTEETTFNFDLETGAAIIKTLNGFVVENGNTYYYIDNVMQKGLQLIDGSYYYFSTNTGIMRTGEYTATVANSNGLLTKNTTFHFDPETGAAAEKPLNGFVKENGNTYYYINNVMQKGLQRIDGYYYYFSINTGIMRTGKYTATVANSNGLLTKNTEFNLDATYGYAVDANGNPITAL